MSAARIVGCGARSEATSRTWRAAFVFAAVVGAGALAGCPPGPTFIVQQYGGPSRPPEAVGTLRVNGGDAVRLLILDDQDVAAPIVEDGRLHIEILPVRHIVVVGNATAPNERYAPLAFQAEPGKVYRVAFVPGAAGDARVYEVDRGKDTPVRDVTLPAGGAPAAPSPAAETPAPATHAPAEPPSVAPSPAPVEVAPADQADAG